MSTEQSSAYNAAETQVQTEVTVFLTNRSRLNLLLCNLFTLFFTEKKVQSLINIEV